MTTFKHGDRVRNVNPSSRYYCEIKNEIGTFGDYWSEKYRCGDASPFPGVYLYSSLNNACDVAYPGVRDLYGRDELAQSADDLELVVRDE
jgi:hypothetical protein